MGTFWLDGRLPDYLPLDYVVAGAGLNLKTYSGWQTRSRSSGGFNRVAGIVIHHTASPSNQSFDNDWNYCAVGHPDAPVANMLLGRDGLVGIHAAGASNHAGKGGPWGSSSGTIPLDSANSYCIGIEAQNNGVGENWSEIMVESYVKLVHALCSAYRLDPLRDIMAHFEWAPTRKIDPWGGNVATPNYPFTGPFKWKMHDFRMAVNNLGQVTPPVPPPTQPGDEEDMMLFVMVPRFANEPGAHSAAWLIRWSSGLCTYATSPDIDYANKNKIPQVGIADKAQYNQLLKDGASTYPPSP